MNYMEKVAEMLGIEIGEKFKIRFESGIVPDALYMFTDNGIYMSNAVFKSEDLLWRLLTGRIEIVKLPWKPENGEIVWYICYDGSLDFQHFCNQSVKLLMLYKLGKLYRTKAEAEKHADEDAAYWESIREKLEE